jgi:hypothetical protein
LIQAACGPDRYGASIRFDTMPSAPSLHACAKTVGPSSAMYSLNTMHAPRRAARKPFRALALFGRRPPQLAPPPRTARPPAPSKSACSPPFQQFLMLVQERLSRSGATGNRARPTIIQPCLQRGCRLLCRFSDAGMTAYPRAEASGVRKAPRHEIAGVGHPAVPRRSRTDRLRGLALGRAVIDRRLRSGPGFLAAGQRGGSCGRRRGACRRLSAVEGGGTA